MEYTPCEHGAPDQMMEDISTIPDDPVIGAPERIPSAWRTGQDDQRNQRIALHAWAGTHVTMACMVVNGNRFGFVLC